MARPWLPTLNLPIIEAPPGQVRGPQDGEHINPEEPGALWDEQEAHDVVRAPAAGTGVGWGWGKRTNGVHKQQQGIQQL
jgi:hypothetical protein